MIENLLETYKKIERKYNIINVSNDFYNLTRSKDNDKIAIVRWYNCKESYSFYLLEKLLNYWNIDNTDNLYDPFLCVGTTLMSAQALNKKGFSFKKCIGTDINPFFTFVSKNKVNWFKNDLNNIKHLIEIIPSNVNLNYRIPQLSTINNEKVFKKDILNEILGFINIITSIKQKEKNLLLLGLSDIIEKMSGIRKDGRALRFKNNKQIPCFKEILYKKWESIIDDLEKANDFYKPIQSYIYTNDARKINHNIYKNNSIDLIMYSPPYLNNIDYSEVYKLELWMLNFIKNKSEFYNLRKKTFRSHPSIKFNDKPTLQKLINTSTIKSTLQKLVENIPKNKNYNWRKRLYQQYYEDIYITLKRQHFILKKNGYIFLIIGNSLHGSGEEKIPIATDLIISEISKEIGFNVSGILISRQLKRRNHNPETNYYLRESIITLKKI